MKAIFVYSDRSEKIVSFLEQPTVVIKVNSTLSIEPTYVYFDEPLTPEQEGSVSTCTQCTRWQYWCLRQTRTYEE